MTKKKSQIKLANNNNNKDTQAKIYMLECMIYRMANDIDLSTGQLITLSQILEKGEKYEKKN